MPWHTRTRLMALLSILELLAHLGPVAHAGEVCMPPLSPCGADISCCDARNYVCAPAPMLGAGFYCVTRGVVTMPAQCECSCEAEEKAVVAKTGEGVVMDDDVTAQDSPEITSESNFGADVEEQVPTDGATKKPQEKETPHAEVAQALILTESDGTRDREPVVGDDVTAQDSPEITSESNFDADVEERATPRSPTTTLSTTSTTSTSTPTTTTASTASTNANPVVTAPGSVVTVSGTTIVVTTSLPPPTTSTPITKTTVTAPGGVGTVPSATTVVTTSLPPPTTSTTTATTTANRGAAATTTTTTTIAIPETSPDQ